MTGRPSLERSLALLAADEVGRVLLAQAREDDVARALMAGDPYQDRAALTRAAALVGPDVDPQAWLAHRIWCAARRASGPARAPLSVRVTGADYLEETRGHATVLVSPMTLDTADALTVVEHLFPARRCVAFGEAMTGDEAATSRVELAAPGQELPHILDVLDADGVYCTYGDFAYQQRAAMTITLFGTPRAISRGWVHISARPDTMLLPITVVRDGLTDVTAHVTEPIVVRGTGDPQQLADLLADLLEQGIRRAGHQWLLLPTLTFHTAQAAQATHYGSDPHPGPFPA